MDEWRVDGGDDAGVCDDESVDLPCGAFQDYECVGEWQRVCRGVGEQQSR